MNDPLQTLLQINASQNLYPVNSRYHGTAVGSCAAADKREVRYLRRRFISPPDRFSCVTEHTITQGDRTDLLAAQYFGDPQLYWRAADANAVMHPDELTDTVGKRIRVTLPEGLPGAPNA